MKIPYESKHVVKRVPFNKFCFFLSRCLYFCFNHLFTLKQRNLKMPCKSRHVLGHRTVMMWVWVFWSYIQKYTGFYTASIPNTMLHLRRCALKVEITGSWQICQKILSYQKDAIIDHPRYPKLNNVMCSNDLPCCRPICWAA